MKTYRIEGTKVYMYIRGKLFDIFLFHTPQEAAEFKEKQMMDQLRIEFP